MNIALWIIQVLLALLFVTAGALKAFSTSKAQQQLAWAKRRSENFVRFVGTAELLGAAGLLLPMITGILPWLTPAAALALALVQVLAILTEHLPAKEFKALLLNLILLVLAIVVAVGRFVIIPV